MQKEQIPLYQIQDFNALTQQEKYFYCTTLSLHLQEHLFTQEPHKHTFYILLFVIRGTGTHTIDFEEFEVQPGSIFFMIPGQVHSWNLSEDAEGYVVFFTDAFYATAYPYRMLIDYPFFNALLYKPVLLSSTQQQAGLIPVLDLLLLEYKKTPPAPAIILSRYLDIILLKLNQLFQEHKPDSAPQKNAQTLLQNLEMLIERYYKEHVPVGFYAEQLHVTTKHLNDTCRSALGKTTSGLVHYRVLLEAQRLLVYTNLTSSQIAAELGYFDTTYFFRFFKKHTGLTPEQFRSANR